METSKPNLPVSTQIFRARKFLLVIPLVLSFGILLITKMDRGGEYFPIFLVLSIGIFFFMWLALQKVSLEINDEGLRYASIFKKEAIRWKDVSTSYIKYRHHGKSGSHYWYFETWEGKKIRFRASLFSRDNLQALANALLQKSSTAMIDDKILRMAEGTFPWYIF